MQRILAVVLALGLSTHAQAQQPPSEGGAPSAASDTSQLKAFDFWGITAGQHVENPRKAGLAVCSKQSNSWFCMPMLNMAGTVANSIFKFEDGYLTSLTLKASRASYPSVLAAFKAKYGEPCSTGSEKWQNAMGASLDNEVHVWCFATGKLRLRAIGDNIRFMQADYADSRSAQAKPIVNF